MELDEDRELIFPASRVTVGTLVLFVFRGAFLFGIIPEFELRFIPTPYASRRYADVADAACIPSDARSGSHDVCSCTRTFQSRRFRERAVEHERNLFLSLAAVLIGFGVLIVHSASVTSRPTEFEQVYLSRHLIYLAIALTSSIVAGSLPAKFWNWVAPFLFWGTVVLLAVVLIPGMGTRVKGAQRWLRLGPWSMQPSELAKLALPLYVSRLMTRSRGLSSAAEKYASSGDRSAWASWILELITPVWPIVLMVGLVIVEPDLGTSMFLALGGGLVLLSGGWPLRNFLLAGSAALPVLGFLVIHKPYQMQRITGFLATWADWTNAPYQLKQSLVTLGAGGVWGVGLGRGFQKLSFLPEANTDFVFAVIGEELGLIGMLTVLALWLGLYWMGIRLIMRLPRADFGHRAAFALLTQLVLQVGMNVAVVTAMVPPKGIAHPLLSYGGSNLVVSICALGIIVSLTRQSDPGPVTEQSLR